MARAWEKTRGIREVNIEHLEKEGKPLLNGSPCFTLLPESVDFGQVEPNSVKKTQVLMMNIGKEPQRFRVVPLFSEQNGFKMRVSFLPGRLPPGLRTRLTIELEATVEACSSFEEKVCIVTETERIYCPVTATISFSPIKPSVSQRGESTKLGQTKDTDISMASTLRGFSRGFAQGVFERSCAMLDEDWHDLLCVPIIPGYYFDIKEKKHKLVRPAQNGFIVIIAEEEKQEIIQETIQLSLRVDDIPDDFAQEYREHIESKLKSMI